MRDGVWLPLQKRLTSSTPLDKFYIILRRFHDEHADFDLSLN